MSQNQKQPPTSFTDLLKNGEKATISLKTWNDHVMNQDTIKSFTTINGSNQILHIVPQKDEVFIPFSEYNGDHSMNWILCINMVTGDEIFRKNTRTADMIDWKLSSF